MNCKLYSNMKKLTTGFCVGILCVTLSVVALRLTVFSDMAAAPATSSSLYSSEDDEFQVNGKIYFSSSTVKGDVYLTNLSDENLIRLDITLADTGASILTSGLVNPGAAVNTLPLGPNGQKLEDGRYDCIAEVTAYNREDSRNPVGTAKVEIEVYIGEKPGKDEK